MLKFRSMHMDNDPGIHEEYVRKLIANEVMDSGGAYKIKDDPRVTPIGRFIRRTSLDELPQFVNVLTGEMSLVGPRPPISYEFETYALWHRRRVLEVKPGITGIWQVHGRSRTTFDEMVRMDLLYIRNQSIWLDLKILLKTPLAVISGAGAF
jgi:lipopolysaccharide/colanic/teichoic acid biosynthesis glycosyltransferase